MSQTNGENRGIRPFSRLLLFLGLAVAVGAMFVLDSTEATPTAKPKLKTAPIQKSLVPVEIVRTEPVVVDGNITNNVTLRNVSDKSIVFLRIFVREDYRGSLTLNCFVRPEGALRPNDEITINNAQPSDAFIVAGAVYTDFTASGDPRVTKGDVEFVRGWTEAARNYKSRMKDLKQRHTPDDTAQLMVQQVLQDQAEAAKGKRNAGQRRNGAEAVYYYFQVILTNSDNKRAALDALERTTNSIAMEGDQQ